MHESERLNDHQKFKELAALAQARALTVSERIELKRHLQLCEGCRAIYSEYSLLSSEGMAFLAADRGRVSEAEAWDYRAAQSELASRIQESETSAIELAPQRLQPSRNWPQKRKRRTICSSCRRRKYPVCRGRSPPGNAILLDCVPRCAWPRTIPANSRRPTAKGKRNFARSPRSVTNWPHKFARQKGRTNSFKWSSPAFTPSTIVFFCARRRWNRKSRNFRPLPAIRTAGSRTANNIWPPIATFVNSWARGSCISPTFSMSTAEAAPANPLDVYFTRRTNR